MLSFFFRVFQKNLVVFDAYKVWQ